MAQPVPPPAGGRGLGGGRTTERLPYDNHHAFQISKDIVVGEMNHPKANLAQISIAPRVAPAINIMREAIDFDHQLMPTTDEVGEKRPNLYLPRKLRAQLRALEGPPH